uniref:Uncharacterized protein n=1 Tax=Vespula pensylvanica TaxID=30213 RepID=A0A834NQM7_VESPE|nr:hypothetical protein H0235_012157 [Vespula pensylvanica]
MKWIIKLDVFAEVSIQRTKVFLPFGDLETLGKMLEKPQRTWEGNERLHRRRSRVPVLVEGNLKALHRREARKEGRKERRQKGRDEREEKS